LAKVFKISIDCRRIAYCCKKAGFFEPLDARQNTRVDADSNKYITIIQRSHRSDAKRELRL